MPADQDRSATTRRTLMSKFWLWRCDNCGLLAYPPEADAEAEPFVTCSCWKGPRWVRYLAIHPTTPQEREADLRRRAAERADNGSHRVPGGDA